MPISNQDFDIDLYQEQVASYCFSKNEAPDSYTEHPRWNVYRAMIRRRIRNLIKGALPLYRKHFGELLDATFNTWLDEAPPRSRYFREVAEEFAVFVEASTTHNKIQKELVRYEITRWKVGYIDVDMPAAKDIDFEKPVCLNPTLVLLEQMFRVHDADISAMQEDKVSPNVIAIFRHPETDIIKVWDLPRFAATHFRIWLKPHQSLKSTLNDSSAELDRKLDEAFVGELSTLLANTIEAKLIRGSV